MDWPEKTAAFGPRLARFSKLENCRAFRSHNGRQGAIFRVALSQRTLSLRRDLLHGPGRAVTLVNDFVGFAMDFVDEAGVLTVPETGLGPAQQLALHVEFINLAGTAVTAVQILG